MNKQPQTRITAKEFRERYGSDVNALAHDLALRDKTRSDQAETAAKGRKKYEYREYELQKEVARYLNYAYPSILFESSPINLNLTKAQRGMNSAIQKKDFHAPDLKIYAARHGYAGLAIELKRETPYLKDGKTLKSSEHLRNQQKSIEQMREQGWMCGFFWEFETIKATLDWYLKGENDE